MKTFIDSPHPIAKEYHVLIKRFTGKNATFIIPRLHGLIIKDPTYLRSYLALYDILDEMGQTSEAQSYLDQAWQQVTKKILPKGGQWPEKMEWKHKSNRHILLTILQKSLILWKQGKNADAQDLFRKLMRMNPTDELGARQLLLACLMEYSFDKFEAEFDQEGFLDDKIDPWFLEHTKQYPAEFQWWMDGKFQAEENETDTEEDDD